MCIKRFEVLCHSLISVYEQGKKIGSYILIIDFFPAQCRVIENLLIHIKKKSAYI